MFCKIDNYLRILYRLAGYLAAFFLILVALFIIVTKGYIKSTNNLGKFYIIATLITASTALMLYKNGGFNLESSLRFRNIR